MEFGRISRRHLLQGGAALTLGTAFGAGAARAADTTIGFIYVGSRDDYGYNQAHAQGAAALKKMPGLKVVEEEKVPETDAVEKTIEFMINLDGASLLFPTSFGYYNPHMIKMAKKFPKLRFEHCGGLWSEKDPTNAGSYFGYIDEAQYISGIVAGYTSKSGKLGFVAAKPIPQVLRNINAFTLGAKLANPKATTQVIFTGDWSMPVKEAEATNSLIDQGVDVLTCHVDGPEDHGRERRAPRRDGVRLSRQPVAAGAEGLSHRRGVELGSAVSEIRQDDRGRRSDSELLSRRPQGRDRQMLALWRGGLGRSAQARRRHQGQVPVRRRLHHLQGRPIMDNKGKTVIPAGTDRGQKDPELEKMDYLVEGVLGATS